MLQLKTNSVLKTGLPKEITSMCPECKSLIKAKVFEENGDVMMEKTCPEHGYFKDKYWSDADYYLWAEKYAYDGDGISNPRTESKTACPGNPSLSNASIHLSTSGVVASLHLCASSGGRT